MINKIEKDSIDWDKTTTTPSSASPNSMMGYNELDVRLKQIDRKLDAILDRLVKAEKYKQSLSGLEIKELMRPSYDK